MFITIINYIKKHDFYSELENNYEITIKTDDYDNAGTNGPVYINIFGSDNKSTGDLLLKTSSNDTSFTQGSLKKIQVQSIDIGKPKRIIIRHEDNTNGWFVEYVEISVNGSTTKFDLFHSIELMHYLSLFRFIANRWLNAGKHDRRLSAELYGSEQPG